METECLVIDARIHENIAADNDDFATEAADIATLLEKYDDDRGRAQARTRSLPALSHPQVGNLARPPPFQE
ncbi:MAG: hypothetical protein J6386_09930 [Candidatus Synoicihabitans palmerolidicus]|nr:hypothetical protein [Candidatus Synoicihabitans palmerolidicus]